MTASASSSSPSPSPSQSPHGSARILPFILDLVAIALFGLAARYAHQSPDMPFNFLGWLSTTWPFWVGVLLAWAIFRKDAVRGFDYRVGAIVWIFAVASGLIIWAIRHAAVPHWSFVLVATVMGALLIFGWRLIASFVRK